MSIRNGIGYELSRAWLRFLYFIFLMDVEFCSENKNLPEKGVIIASNHFSNLDPPLIMGAYPYKISFVAKKELFKIPYIGRLIRALNMIPINRSAFSPSTLRTVMKRINENNIVIFPEGTRSRTGKIGPGKPGFGYMVKKLECDVLPMHIDSFHLLKKGSFFITPGRVNIKVGKILSYDEILDSLTSEDEKDKYQEISDIVLEKINILGDK